MWSIALPPPPPTPITLMWAARFVSTGSIISMGMVASPVREV
jgi:hypothetical protein